MNSSCKCLYRNLIKTCNEIFNADVEAKCNVLTGVKNIIREETKTKNDNYIKQQLIEANDFIRKNIIQAVYNDSTGNYKVHLTKDHVKSGSITLGTKFEKKLPF
ncbi:conserved protein, unknown function [Hepatocystis sp. ex Piliocolobus tephrosceles]|nr:conserved protein, unknown function [Hepatocystis sp. ex Piliocolobus tephrosceles]